ncbi:MAG: PKD domain-containing protein [Planctomycetota bacterium]|nr:PKD domain-containing protein [Planctomycetota bacterium]
MTLYKAEVASLNFSAPNLNFTGPQDVTVSAAGVTYYTTTGFGSSQEVGVPFSVTVTPYDNWDNMTTGGTVSLTAVAPDGVGSVSGNLYISGGTTTPSGSTASGSVTIANVIYTRPETIDIQASDGTNTNVIANSTNVMFARTDVVASITVDDPAAAVNVEAGEDYTVKATAYDAWGNTCASGTALSWSTTIVSGTVNATLASSSTTCDASGQANVVVTVTTTAGDAHTVTATNGTVTATTPNLNVIANSTLASVGLSCPSTATAGVNYTLTATAYDAYGNFITNYSTSTGVTVTGPNNAPDGTVPLLPTAIPFGSGTASLNVTLYKAEVASLNFSAPNLNFTGPQDVTVSAAGVTYYTTTGFGSSQEVGVPFSVTVTPYDNWDNMTTGGTVSLTAVAPDGVGSVSGNLYISGGTTTPSGSTASGSVTIANVIYTRPETIDIQASDGTNTNVIANSTNVMFARTDVVASITVDDPAAAVNVEAGEDYTVKATAYDAWGNYCATGTALSWSTTIVSGTVNATLASSSTTCDASGQANVVLTVTTTAGDAHTVTATNGTVTATTPNLNVIANSTLASIGFTGPATATAGVAYSLTANAYDAYGNFINYYTTTTAITVSGPSNAPDGTTPILPSTVPFAAGTATVSVTLYKAEVASLNIQSGSLSITNPQDVTVSAASVSYYTTTGFGSSQEVGVPFSVTVTPYDNWDNMTTGGTVSLTAVAPDGVGSVSGNLYISGGTTTPSGSTASGSVTIANVIYTRPETIDIQASDGTNTNVIANSTNVMFARTDVVASITVDDPAAAVNVEAGEDYTVKATAYDAWGNYCATGTALSWSTTIVSGTANATLASSSTTCDASGQANVVLTVTTTAGDAHTVTATNGTVTATTPNLNVIANSTLASVGLSGPSTATAGVTYTLTATAYDAYNNVISYYSTSTGVTVTGPNNAPDGTAPLLPSAIPFGSGTASLNVTLYKAEVATLTFNASNINFTGPQDVTVSAAPVNYYETSGFSNNQTVGAIFSVTVTPYDNWGNLTTGGTVNLTAVAPDGVGTVTGNLYISGGTTTPSGSTASGSVTIANVIYTRPETIDIQASDGSNTNNISTSTNVVFARTDVVASISITDPVAATNVMAGGNYTVEATAYDAYSNTVASGTSVSWTYAMLGGTTNNGTLANATTTTNVSGVASVLFTPSTTSGDSYSVTATNGTVTATSPAINVVHNNTVGSIQFTAPSTATAGTAFNLSGSAFDTYSNAMSTYNGTVAITVTGANNAPDGTNPMLPTSITFSSGSGTASVTLYNAAVTTLNVAATSSITVSGPSAVTVSPAVVSTYILSGFPTSHVTNEPFNLTITPNDSWGNVTSTNGNTLNVTTVAPSSGSTPAGSAMTLVNGSSVGPFTGQATVNNLRYTDVGYVDLYVQDTFGTMSNVNNTADVFFDATTKVGSITVDFPSNPSGNVRAGDDISVRAQLLDANGNAVKQGQSVTWSYTRTSGTSANGAIGANPFTNDTTSDASGYLTVTFTPSTTSGDTFTVSALNNATGTSPTITMLPDDVISEFTMTTVSLNVTAGTSFQVTIQPWDVYGNHMNDYSSNTALTFSGSATAASGDAPAWPANPVTFLNGSASEPVTLYMAETTDITVELSSDSTVNGTLEDVVVGPAVVDYYTVTAPASAIAHDPFDVTVTPYDDYDNKTVGSATVTLTARVPNGGAGTTDGTLSGTTTVDTSSGETTVQVSYNRLDTIDIYANDGTNFSDDTVTQDTSFSPNVPAHIVFTPLNATYTAGVSVPVEVTVYDAVGGNLVSDGHVIDWTFSGTGTGGSFGGFNNPAAFAATSNTSGGTAIITFYPDTVAGSTYTIHAGWDNSVTASSTTFEVVPAATDYLTVDVPTAEQIAGVVFDITITAYDEFDNVNTLLDTTETIALVGPSPARVLGTPPILPTSASFTDGVAIVSVTLYRAEETDMTCDLSGAMGTSDEVTVVPNDLMHYEVVYDLAPPVIEEYAPFGTTVYGVDEWYNRREGATSVEVFAEAVSGPLMGTLSSTQVPSLIISTTSGSGEIPDLVYSEAQQIYIAAEDGNGIRSDNAITGVLDVIDTVPPTWDSGYTLGDGNGNTTEAYVVFDEIMTEQPGFLPGSFTIDGIGATAYSWVDSFTLHLVFGNPVPGTEPKDLVFLQQMPAGLTDTVGNPLAGFTETLEDQAEPVLMTFATTNPDSDSFLNDVVVTYSEDLDPASATLAGWMIVDNDGVTDLLGGLTDADVEVIGSDLIFHLANNSGSLGLPFFMYRGSSVMDPAGNLAAHEGNNSPPTVTADADQLSILPQLVMLGATAGDADQPTDTLMVEWELESGPATVDIQDPNALHTQVILTKDGSYVFRIRVYDVFGVEATDVMTVSIVNVAPVANAGTNVFVDRDLAPTATLDGQLSYDPNGDVITYNWTGVGSLNISDPGAMSPSIAPTVDGVFPVTLMVMDDDGATDTETINVIVFSDGNGIPISDAGKDQHGVANVTVQLDGRGSYDVDGDDMNYAWTQEAGPLVTITNANTSLATFTPTAPGIYVFELNVDDGVYNGLSDEVVVTVISDTANNAPVADAGDDRVVNFGGNVTLDGSDSYDADGDPLTYMWSVEGSWATLDNAMAMRPEFTPVMPGTYVFHLTVSDGINFSYTDEVVIQVVEDNLPPMAVAGYEDPGEVGFYLPVSINLTNTSYDADGDHLMYRWVQTAGPVVHFAPNAKAPSFTPKAAGIYVFELYVYDGMNLDMTEVIVPVNSIKSRIAIAETMEDRPFHVNKEAYVKGSGGMKSDGHVWVQMAGPTFLRFEENYRGSMKFLPTVMGTYTFGLYTWNGEHKSLVDIVNIQVVSADEPLPSNGGGGGCFVATAAFGSLATDSVEALTTVRDSALASSVTSDTLTGLYYSVSPAVANELAASDAVRALMRRLLDR